ncbi:hypothetical protein ABI59_05260 [Acidobacteria bacterium Mor1]|nr:hypothetical protein ABI59_05260 [Acidobacteria bacterium Mor1]
MRPLKNLSLILIALLLATPGAADNMFDPSNGTIVERSTVPPGEKRIQGEVRLVDRDGHLVVQTVLYSKVLKRVLGSIVEKEEGNWPAAHDDSIAYRNSLNETVTMVVDAPRGVGNSRQRAVLIEFFVWNEKGFVVLSGASIDERSDEFLRVRRLAAPTNTLELNVDYVQENMALILADSFELSREAADAMIERHRRKP